MDINTLRQREMQEIADFYHFIQEYVHIFHLAPNKLEDAFKKIMEGISEIQGMVEESYGM